MIFAYFILLYLCPSFIMLDMEECVSVIFLQLIVLPFSLVAILVSSNVYTSIFPFLPLSIGSIFFVYLS
jgi:hypothetical protein